ncbi:MAG: twin-arginine translocation signal domain-containing protein, partial [Planctomycetota bacterium]
MKQDLNRRSFLKAAAIGGAAAVASPAPLGRAQESESDNKWRMRLSTSSIHFMGLPIEQACERISRLGFEAIDIWSAHQGCPHLDDVLDRLGPEGLKELLAENRLKLFAFSVYRGGYERYAELLGKAGGGVAVRGSSGPCKPQELTA